MALKVPAQFEGRLAADPQTQTSSRTGKEFVTFKLLNNERVKDEAGNFTDGETTAVDVQVHDEGLRQHVMNSLKKGNRVSVDGTLTSRPYATKDGELGIGHNMMAKNVYASLRFNDLTITPNKPSASASASAEVSADPWADVEVANVNGATATPS